LDLSDAGLVKNNKSLFNSFIKEYVDIVFANESEATALTGKNPELALLDISKICKIAIVKIGEKGSLIRTNNITYKIPPYLTKIINTNGAGDMYSASILFGIVNNWNIEKSGKVASYSASLVVGKPSARYGPELKNKIDKFISDNKL
jgi:sugar/nucleoside kinase (ribokinase family)